MVLAKQNWALLKTRNANLDEGSITHEVNVNHKEESPVEKILNCARLGEWALICPVAFP